MATTKLIYEDFGPFWKWIREEASDTLEVHLPGFKKEQLKVQMNNVATLTISGERPLEDNKKWSRFHKVIKVTNDYKTNEIHAKFAGEKLYVTLPKKTPLLATLVDCNQEITSGGIRRFKISKMKALNVTVGVAVLVALAAYIYKYCQCCCVKN